MAIYEIGQSTDDGPTLEPTLEPTPTVTDRNKTRLPMTSSNTSKLPPQFNGDTLLSFLGNKDNLPMLDNNNIQNHILVFRSDPYFKKDETNPVISSDKTKVITIHIVCPPTSESSHMYVVKDASKLHGSITWLELNDELDGISWNKRNKINVEVYSQEQTKCNDFLCVFNNEPVLDPLLQKINFENFTNFIKAVNKTKGGKKVRNKTRQREKANLGYTGGESTNYNEERPFLKDLPVATPSIHKTNNAEDDTEQLFHDVTKIVEKLWSLGEMDNKLPNWIKNIYKSYDNSERHRFAKAIYEWNLVEAISIAVTDIESGVTFHVDKLNGQTENMTPVISISKVIGGKRYTVIAYSRKSIDDTLARVKVVAPLQKLIFNGVNKFNTAGRFLQTNTMVLQNNIKGLSDAPSILSSKCSMNPLNYTYGPADIIKDVAIKQELNFVGIISVIKAFEKTSHNAAIFSIACATLNTERMKSNHDCYFGLQVAKLTDALRTHC